MKSKLAITLDEDILKKVNELADKESRSVSSQINKILKDYFKEEES